MTSPATTTIAPTAIGSLSISASDFEQVLGTTYDPTQQEILRFWYFTAKEHNWGLKKLSNLTGISSTVLHRLFRGEYGADPASSIQKLARSRENFHENADNPEFIQTSLASRLFVIFDKTRALRNVSILWGRMGIGKTECIAEYQRLNNHGRTLVVRFPSGTTFAFFVTHLARACGVSTRSQSAFDQRAKILSVLSAGQRLLIIDELHQAFLTTRSDTAVKCCEFLREIADTANCGLVLVGTELLEENFFRGQHKDALRQLVDRGTVQVPLPSKATKADYQKFLANYGLTLPDPNQWPEAADILADIIKAAGLRKLTLHLRDGAAYAAKRDQPYTWEHFVAAFEAIQSLSK